MRHGRSNLPCIVGVVVGEGNSFIRLFVLC